MILGREEFAFQSPKSVKGPPGDRKQARALLVGPGAVHPAAPPSRCRRLDTTPGQALTGSSELWSVCVDHGLQSHRLGLESQLCCL